MSDPKLDLLLHRRPVRASVGFLAGLLLGPLIGYLLVHAPSSEWLGPYSFYMVDCEFLAVLMGVCFGTVVGLTVALFVSGLQRWKWERAEPDSGPWCSEPEKVLDQPDRGISSDGRISRRTDIASSMD